MSTENASSCDNITIRGYITGTGMYRFLCLVMLICLLGLPNIALAERDEGMISIREYGAVGDGRTNDTPAFRRALEAIGGEEATIRIMRDQFVIDGVTFPENVSLMFRNGGGLFIPEGGTIQIHGTIASGITRIFSGEGTVEGQIKNRYVYPQWFGARGDGKHDDAQAIQKAADLAATAMGQTLFIPQGEYLFNEDISLRSNVENRGVFVIALEIDEDRTEFSHDLYLPTHHPENTPVVRFEADHPEQELDPKYFFGIEEGDLSLPVFQQVPLADGSGHIALSEGGVIRLYSSDFFSSRRVRKGAHYYDRNDISQLVSGRGDVFPEFAFDYSEPPDADPWNEHTVYDKGDYCSFEGEIFKATWPSGEGTFYRHPHLGKVEIRPVPPENTATTSHEFTYEDGTEDNIFIWRRVRTQVWYREKDSPVTVNGLRIEVRLKDHGGETKRIAAGAAVVSRSNMTFNNLEISVRDREATMSRLLQSTNSVNNEFNNGYFSGATSAHLGYNILNSNVSNFRYNNCISTNSRKGMDGRHAKNISVQGGYYNVIEDHYGRNFIIRDVVVSGLSVRVPGDSTPDADLQAWEFSPRRPFGLSGANMHVENSVIDKASGGIFGARADIGDLYGTIVLKNIVVRRNDGDVRLFHHHIDPDFDYAHKVRVPDNVIIENISLENPGRLLLNIGSGFDGGTYGPVHVRNTGPIGDVSSTSPSTNFLNCTFEDAEFELAGESFVTIRNSTFFGDNHGLNEDYIGIATGNIRKNTASVSFPLEFFNKDVYTRTPSTE